MSIAPVSTEWIEAAPFLAEQLLQEALEKVEQKDFAKALSRLDEVLRIDPENVKALIVRARTLVLSGGDRRREALEDAQKAVQIEPDQREALLACGVILVLLGDPIAALEYLERAISRVHPLFDSEERLSAEAIFWRGRAKFSLHQHLEALQDAEKSLETYPHDVKILDLAVTVLHLQRRFGEGLRRMAQFQKSYRGSIEGLEELQEKVEIFRKMGGRDLAPAPTNNARSLFSLAIAKCREGKYRESQLLLKKVEQLDPSNPYALFLLSRMQKRLQLPASSQSLPFTQSDALHLEKSYRAANAAKDYTQALEWLELYAACVPLTPEKRELRKELRRYVAEALL